MNKNLTFNESYSYYQLLFENFVGLKADLIPRELNV